MALGSKFGIRRGLLLGAFLALGFALSQANAVSDPPPVRYVEETSNDYVVYTVILPPSNAYRLRPVVSSKVETVDVLAKSLKSPLAAINAGFFDPNNDRTTSYVSFQGKTLADPTQNPRLMTNPSLKPYLPAMLNRSEFRVMRCQGKTTYQITRHYAPLRTGCRLESALQAGPNLFDPASAQTEAFIATNAKGQRTRDPLGVDHPNARSAIGLDSQGNVVLMMVGMTEKSEGPSGVTLAALKNLLADRGVSQALALDGGGSSSLWFNGQTVYGKLDANQVRVQRPVKSAWVIESTDGEAP